MPVMAWTVVDDNGKRFIDGDKAVVTFSLNGINKCTANNNGAGFIETEV